MDTHAVGILRIILSCNNKIIITYIAVINLHGLVSMLEKWNTNKLTTIENMIKKCTDNFEWIYTIF